MTFERAKQVAKKYNPKVDVYQEYPDVYLFFIEKPTKVEMLDNEVIIRKDNGKIISYTEYIMTSKYADESPIVKHL